MMLCAHQPVYLPSIHLFNKISFCDSLVLLGHCQFVKQSWHSRNQIRSGNNKLFLTVPVLRGNKIDQRLDDTLICNDHWKRKHLRSIRESYSKRPYFKDYFPEIEQIILHSHKNLIAMNNALLLKFLLWLDLTPKIIYSENYDIKDHKTDMLITLCKMTSAAQYVSNEGARTYLDEGLFKQNNIQHYWQEFTHPIYDQGANFIPNLSIIDALFNIGPDCANLVRDSGTLILSK
ncbi:MAG: WbqC family protein [Emcibacter sp.]|nr:WbqC family protein [Emcibacter sp.]